MLKEKSKHVISLFIALILSCVMSYIFSASSFFLMPLTTLFVMLTSIGNVIYQGIMRFLVMLLVLVLLVLFFPSEYSFYLYARDAALGALLGITANLILFPRHADTAFRDCIVPIVKTYQHYFSEIMQLFLSQDARNISIVQITMENRLLTLPHWVYSRGFDSGLRKGHQFFLQKIEQVSDILFSMHHLAHYAFDENLMLQLQDSFTECASHVQEFFTLIITVMSLSKSYAVNDFADELNQLEKKFQQVVPYNLESIDIRRDYVYLAEFIYLFNELRTNLVKLIQALR